MLTEFDICLPAWTREFLEKYRAGIAHQFLFHFNVGDYLPTEENYLTLKEFLTELGRQRLVIFYDISAGLQFVSPKAVEVFKKIVGKDTQGGLAGLAARGQALETQKNPSQVLPLLEKFFKTRENGQGAMVVIEYAETIAPAGFGGTVSSEDRVNVTTLRRWAQDKEIRERENLIILLTANIAEIADSLRAGTSGVEAILIPKPTEEERQRYIEFLQGKRAEFKSEIPSEQFAKITAGLSFKQIEEICLRAEEEGSPINISFVKERKKQILDQEYGELLEIMEPVHGLETIGGLEHLKRAFRKITQALKEGKYRRVPMGVLFLGPPGTGKTVLAEALAKESGFNFAVMKNIREKWVGSSERNLSRVLCAIRSLTPIVVFVDEIDQVEGSRGETGDSNVSKRMFGQILQFMSDTSLRGKVLWIGASNRPDLIDVAMKRPGRFDWRIPFLYPDLEEREKIFPAILTKYKIKSQVEDFLALALRVEDYNGADIERIVLTAFNFAQDDGREKVNEEDFQKAIEDYLPSRDEKMYQYMTRLAIQECSSKSFLPPNYLEILQAVGGNKK